MDIEKVREVLLESNSKADILRKIGYSPNGRNNAKLNLLIDEYDLDLSHFILGLKTRKYDRVEKVCVVCDNKFKVKLGHKKEKVTCSHACANTHFRSGEDHPNYRSIDDYNTRTSHFARKYREICFEHHEHKCVICDELKLLDVHHYDGNKFNNEPENLVPICATHHNYVHSEYKDEVIGVVDEYVKKFKNNMKG